MVTPTADFRRTEILEPPKLLKGIDGLVYRFWGKVRRAAISRKALSVEADAIIRAAAGLTDLGNKALQEQLYAHQARIRRGGKQASEGLHEALACIFESARRRLHLTPHPVQVMAALAIYRGMLVEMATGEGKTLTIAMAAVLSGWSQRPCHIITANDYLAQRDAAGNRGFYEFCGLTVADVTQNTDHAGRITAYQADIVYTTSKELLADFLRDRIAMGRLQDANRRMIRSLHKQIAKAVQERVVLRGIDTVIVDEADSLLIDEAVTPLVISQPQKNEALVEAVRKADWVARRLEEGPHFTRDEATKKIELKKAADDIIKPAADTLHTHYRALTWMREVVTQSLVAHTFFHIHKQYEIRDNEIVIVDEFTGRLMPGRSWRQGLHQAVEAKEDVPITDPSESLARLSFQRFFRFCRRLSAITGTCREVRDEFWTTYRLPFLGMRTHRPCVRNQLPVRIFAHAGDRWDALVAEVSAIHATGRPILVGTRNVEASEYLAKRLLDEGIDSAVLNAVRSTEEAVVIQMAGRKGRVTIATNMAGRGSDIKIDDDVEALGGLHVIASEHHESARIDRQLYGRSGRQGQPGSARGYASLEDDLFVRHLPAVVRRLFSGMVRTKLPGNGILSRIALRLAQARAARRSYQQRKATMRQDAWIEDTFSRSSTQIGI